MYLHAAWLELNMHQSCIELWFKNEMISLEIFEPPA